MIPESRRPHLVERLTGGAVLLGMVLGALMVWRIEVLDDDRLSDDAMGGLVVLLVLLLGAWALLGGLGAAARALLGRGRRRGLPWFVPAKLAFGLLCIVFGAAFSLRTYQMLGG